MAALTGSYGNFFDSLKKRIVIYKDPIKTAVNAASQSLYGYDSVSNETNYVYTPVSGIFSGIISNSDSVGRDEGINDANVTVNPSTLQLKVEKDARDFITTDKTEKIEIQGRSFNVVGGDKRLSFLSKDYFIFNLQELG